MNNWKHWEIEFLEDNLHLTDQQISEHLGRGKAGVKKKRLSLGLKKRKGSRYNLNEDFFKTWSNEMAYMLGFIYADGCIHNNNLQIEITDLSLLHKIQTAMQCTIPIYSRDRGTKPIHNLKISRRKIVEDLKLLGVTPRKSRSMVLPDIPEDYFWHFFRGYFDGDGYTRIDKNSLRISIVSGSETFILQLGAQLARRQINHSVREIKSTSVHPKYILSILKDDRDTFCKKLYRDSTIYLDRKYHIIKHYFEEIKSTRF